MANIFRVKPGLYFSRRLSAAVAYSFVARAGDHGRHRQLSFKCARALKKYKQSLDRTTKWSIYGIQMQMQIRIRIQISSLSWMATHIVGMLLGQPICLGIH